MADQSGQSGKSGPRSTPWFFSDRKDLTTDDYIRHKRNLVRRIVTYASTAYLFVGGAGMALLIALTVTDANVPIGMTTAKDVYMSIVPVASGVIAYWFASGRAGGGEELNNEGEPR